MAEARTPVLPEYSRYHRQMLLPGIGEAGQHRLRAATAVVLGCGALGSTTADMLCRAGVGRLVLVDRDFVELTNLQRQVLYDEQDVADALPKAEAARRRLTRINHQVEIEAVVDDIHAGNIERLVADADILIDGLDNFETRYLLNDCAVRHGLPWLYGGAVGTEGMTLAILPHTPDGRAPWEDPASGAHATPCLRCLFEEPPPGQTPTCDTAGVLGPVVGMIASAQAAEAIKLLCGRLDLVSDRLLSIDLWSNQFLRLGLDGIREQADCPCCLHRRFDYLEGRSGSQTASLCGREAVQLRHRQLDRALDLEAIGRRLAGQGEVRVNEFMLRLELRDQDRPFEISLFPDGRAIIKGTDDPAVARGLYARYVGH